MKKTYIFEGTIFSEQPLATCSKDLMDREGVQDGPVPVPSCSTELGKRLMFPGTGIRGTLRRKTRDAIRKRVSEITGKEKPFTLDEIYLATLGGIKGKGAEDKNSVAHIAEWRAKNPQLSIFGAGDAGFLNFVDGNLSVGNAICIEACRPEIFSGARTDEFYRDKSQVNYLTEDDVHDLIARSKGNNESSRLKKHIDVLKKSLLKARKDGNREEAERLEAEIADADGKKSDSNSVGMPLAGFMAIPEGQKLRHRMILTQTTEVELGLMLAGLDEFSRFPIIGAHFATGCGLVSAEWMVYEAGPSGKVEIGVVKAGDFSPITLDGGKLNSAFEAFENFMHSKQWNFSIPSAE